MENKYKLAFYRIKDLYHENSCEDTRIAFWLAMGSLLSSWMRDFPNDAFWGDAYDEHQRMAYNMS